MKKRVLGKFRRTLRSLKNRFMQVSLVLMYHRVADINTDPWQLSVSPRHFSEHLEVLQKLACSLRLDRLASALIKGKIPKRSVVITFDDGYIDNLHTAKPLLERFHIPATFFLSTGCIEKNREFWWDELDRLILQPVIIPKRLSLTIQGKKYEWDLDRDLILNEDPIWNNSFWRTLEKAPRIRHGIYYSLWKLLKPMGDSERRDLLEELQEWAGSQPLKPSTQSLLRPGQISLLGKGDMIEIGAHSATHAALPSQSLSYQQDEIKQSKYYLENILGKPITSFSYPHGEYTSKTMALVRDAGFSCACTTDAAVVFSSTDRFQLPRWSLWNRGKSGPRAP